VRLDHLCDAAAGDAGVWQAACDLQAQYQVLHLAGALNQDCCMRCAAGSPVCKVTIQHIQRHEVAEMQETALKLDVSIVRLDYLCKDAPRLLGYKRFGVQRLSTEAAVQLQHSAYVWQHA
jgi:hypothetical protein